MAVGAGAVLWGKHVRGTPHLSWCDGNVHPLAEKCCSINRGTITENSRAQLELFMTGPDFEAPLLMEAHSVRLDKPTKKWLLTLSYNHTFLVPGRYEYWVRMTVNGQVLDGVPIGYELQPFSYGV